MQESGENYLEAIYVLSQSGAGVHASQVAARLGFSKPSVTRAVGILKNSGFVTIDVDRHIILTDKGHARAQEIFERHQIITEFWVLLGVSRAVADEDACRMEHDISEETFLCIKDYVTKNSRT